MLTHVITQVASVDDECPGLGDLALKGPTRKVGEGCCQGGWVGTALVGQVRARSRFYQAFADPLLAVYWVRPWTGLCLIRVLFSATPRRRSLVRSTEYAVNSSRSLCLHLGPENHLQTQDWSVMMTVIWSEIPLPREQQSYFQRGLRVHAWLHCKILCILQVLCRLPTYPR